MIAIKSLDILNSLVEGHVSVQGAVNNSVISVSLFFTNLALISSGHPE